MAAVNGTDQRTGRRYEAVLKVSFATDKAFIQEYTRNISKGGIFIQTQKVHKPQTVVLVRLEIPSLKAPLEMPAEVVHAIEPGGSQPPGMGLQFLDIPPDVQEQLQQILAELSGPHPAAGAETDPPGNPEHSDGGMTVETLFPVDPGQKDVPLELLGSDVLDAPDEAEHGEAADDETTEAASESRSSASGASDTSTPMYKQIAAMSESAKVAFAGKAGREARMFLLREKNPTVINQVLRNPLLQQAEVIHFLKTAAPSTEVIKYITSRQDWMSIEEVRRTLVLNPKTPLPVVKRYMPQLSTRDLKALAKSHKVHPQVKRTALKIYLERQGKPA